MHKKEHQMQVDSVKEDEFSVHVIRDFLDDLTDVFLFLMAPLRGWNTINASVISIAVLFYHFPTAGLWIGFGALFMYAFHRLSWRFKLFILISLIVYYIMWMMWSQDGRRFVVTKAQWKQDVRDSRIRFLPEVPSSLEKYDVVIIGAGLSGSVIAQRYSEMTNKKILVIDKRGHIGGNCYDEIDEKSGIRVQRYGAHLFHTNDERVWEYVQRFSHWTRWEHRVLSKVNQSYVPFPINMDTINSLYGTQLRTGDQMKEWLESRRVQLDTIENGRDLVLSMVGEELYKTFFESYTKKQWNKDPAELDKAVLARIPLRFNNDDRYFSDKYQALPTHGYTTIFENMLTHPNIDVLLNVDFSVLRSSIPPRTKIVFTGPIDSYFGEYGLPPLEYRSLHFHYEYYDTEGYIQPSSVINFPQPNTPYTRAIEFKHFLHQTSHRSVVVKETSNDEGDPYYPVLNERNTNLYEMYKQLASQSDATFVGRLATFKYYNMDQAIAAALKVADDLLEVKECSYEIVMSYYNEDWDTVVRNVHELRDAIGCGNVVPVILYNKGPNEIVPLENMRVIKLDNIGREGHTHLHHIVTHYGKMARYTVFTQAGIHDMHHVKPILSKCVLRDTGFMPLVIWHSCWHCLRGDELWSKYFHLIYTMMNNKPLPYNPSISYMGQFLVSSAQILKHPLEKYKMLKSMFEFPDDHELNHRMEMPGYGTNQPSNPLFGHSLERAWASVFDCIRPELHKNCHSLDFFLKHPEQCQCLV